MDDGEIGKRNEARVQAQVFCQWQSLLWAFPLSLAIRAHHELAMAATTEHAFF